MFPYIDLKFLITNWVAFSYDGSFGSSSRDSSSIAKAAFLNNNLNMISKQDFTLTFCYFYVQDGVADGVRHDLVVDLRAHATHKVTHSQ